MSYSTMARAFSGYGCTPLEVETELISGSYSSAHGSSLDPEMISSGRAAFPRSAMLDASGKKLLSQCRGKRPYSMQLMENAVRWIRADSIQGQKLLRVVVAHWIPTCFIQGGRHSQEAQCLRKASVRRMRADSIQGQKLLRVVVAHWIPKSELQAIMLA